jgi:hypothetical protein
VDSAFLSLESHSLEQNVSVAGKMHRNADSYKSCRCEGSCISSGHNSFLVHLSNMQFLPSTELYIYKNCNISDIALTAVLLDVLCFAQFYHLHESGFRKAPTKN